MSALQIVGALMIVALFAAAFAFIGVMERSWKVPAAIFGAVASIIGFIALASALLTGAIS